MIRTAKVGVASWNRGETTDTAVKIGKKCRKMITLVNTFARHNVLFDKEGENAFERSDKSSMRIATDCFRNKSFYADYILLKHWNIAFAIHVLRYLIRLQIWRKIEGAAITSCQHAVFTVAFINCDHCERSVFPTWLFSSRRISSRITKVNYYCRLIDNISSLIIQLRTVLAIRRSRRLFLPRHLPVFIVEYYLVRSCFEAKNRRLIGVAHSTFEKVVIFEK